MQGGPELIILIFLKLKDKNRRPPLHVVAFIIRKLIFLERKDDFVEMEAR